MAEQSRSVHPVLQPALEDWPCCHVAVELFCQGLPLVPTVSGWSCWAELPVSCGSGTRGQLRAPSAMLQGDLQSRMGGLGSSTCKEETHQVLPQALHAVMLPGHVVALW